MCDKGRANPGGAKHLSLLVGNVQLKANDTFCFVNERAVGPFLYHDVSDRFSGPVSVMKNIDQIRVRLLPSVSTIRRPAR